MSKRFGDPVWYESPGVLTDGALLFEFWPTADMTVSEKVNALTRFVVISTVLVLIVSPASRRTTYLAAGISLVMSFAALHYLGSGEKKFRYNLRKRTDAAAAAQADTVQGQGASTGDTADCTRPTKDNPFMNVQVADYQWNPYRPPACDYSEVREEIKRALGISPGKPVSVREELNLEESYRQFYTTPNTRIPNDQTEFARFLYGQTRNCKTVPGDCAGPDGNGIFYRSADYSTLI